MNDQESPTTKAKATPARKKGWALWIAALFLLVGLGAIYHYVPLPKELAGLTTTVPLPKASETLSKRITALEETLAALPQAPPGSSSALNTIETDIASLDARLAALEQRATQSLSGKETGALKPEIEKLQNELQNLSSRLASVERDPKKAALLGVPMNPRLRAVEDLREGLWEYGPFSEQLAALLSVAGDDPVVIEVLAPIAAYADQGIPTLPILRVRFDDMAAAVLEAGWMKPEADWREKILANLAGVVTIRRTGTLEGDNLEAVLARAEVALNSGDLERTVSLLDGIGEPALKAAESWFRDARARLAAETAIRRLRKAALSKGKTPTESQQ